MNKVHDHPTWQLIRLNVSIIGWRHVIARETIAHMTSLFLSGYSSNYQSLHAFYEQIATAAEKKQMLQAGYQPLS